MPKLLVLVPLLVGLLITACGQKGLLYIPPEQQTAASAPPDAAEALDEDLAEVERPIAQSQDEETGETDSDTGIGERDEAGETGR